MTLAELQSKTRFLLFRDSTNTIYSNTDITIALNNYYHRITAKILKIMGEWELNGDSQTTALVADQQEYPLPLDLIALGQIEINYSGGDDGWKKANILDMREISEPLSNDTALFTTDNPQVRVFDNSIFIHPKPTVGIAGGLKIYISKEQTELSASTDKPNLSENAQMYLVYGACLDFSIGGENLKRINVFENQLAKIENEINDYYTNRLPARQVRLTAQAENF